MTDHAVFVPTSEGPVGGVVSEPEGEALAGMMLLPGYGRPARSGVNSFWTRLARSLAERGVIVLRVDYSREGETLPIGEGISGQAWKSGFDARLLAQVLPWFHERLAGLDLLLAGACSGARAVVELAGRDHPNAVARTFLLVPHLRVLDGAGGPCENPAGGVEMADPDAVDPLVVGWMQAILGRAPGWILVGEQDTAEVPLLGRLIGPTAHELELEVEPGIALHFLDRPELQERAGRRLVAAVERALQPLPNAVRGSGGPRATASR